MRTVTVVPSRVGPTCTTHRLAGRVPGGVGERLLHDPVGRQPAGRPSAPRCSSTTSSTSEPARRNDSTSAGRSPAPGSGAPSVRDVGAHQPDGGAYLLEAVPGQPLGLHERPTRLVRVLVEGEPRAADVQQGHRERVADDVVHLGGDPVALLGAGPLGQLVLGCPQLRRWRAAGGGRRSSTTVVNEMPANQAPQPGSAVSMSHSTTGTTARTAPDGDGHRGRRRQRDPGRDDAQAQPAQVRRLRVPERTPARPRRPPGRRPSASPSARRHASTTPMPVATAAAATAAEVARSVTPRRGRRTARARRVPPTRAVRSVMGHER